MNSGKKSFLNRNNEDKNSDEQKESNGSVIVSKAAKKVLMLALPIVLLLLSIIAIMAILGSFAENFGDALGAALAAGGDTNGELYDADPDAAAFYERINNVKLEYQSEGKTVDELQIAAVFNIIKNNGGDIEYKDISERDIKKVADAMFKDNTYDQEYFKENLVNDIFKKYLPHKTVGEREQYAEDVFTYIDDYKSYIGLEEDSSVCGATGSCVYDIKGFRLGANSKKQKAMQISNLQVRLMECGSPYGKGSYNKAIDQPMVEFEKYVTGVAYAEIGTGYPEEAIKAQLVAARSYALARPAAMNNANGKKLAQENGQWVLQISSCVADQVFCNIDEGCSYMGGGDGQGGIVRSGKISGAIRTRDALPADNRLRKIASEVQGEILVDNQGYVVNAGYVSTIQKQFKSLAEQGYNYKQILLQVYNKQKKMGAADIQKMSCNSGGDSTGCGVTGPYANWKQFGESWSNIYLGSSSHTIGRSGCLVTSIAMLIAKSGVPTNIQGEFNPGSFVKYLNNHGGFIGANFVWSSVSKAAPTFKYKGDTNLFGRSKSEKIRLIKEKLDAGYYVVIEVKRPTGQHWVAVDRVEGNNIIMMDPASKETIVWNKYNPSNTSMMKYFKVEG